MDPSVGREGVDRHSSKLDGSCMYTCADVMRIEKEKHTKSVYEYKQHNHVLMTNIEHHALVTFIVRGTHPHICSTKPHQALPRPIFAASRN